MPLGNTGLVTLGFLRVSGQQMGGSLGTARIGTHPSMGLRTLPFLSLCFHHSMFHTAFLFERYIHTRTAEHLKAQCDTQQEAGADPQNALNPLNAHSGSQLSIARIQASIA